MSREKLLVNEIKTKKKSVQINLRGNVWFGLLLGMFLGVASAFAAQAPEGMLGGRSGMMLASQAALQLSRELRFSEDQQKELSSRLNEMADRHGWIDSATARNIALGIQAIPTQAGPALVKEGEAEEKEEGGDGGAKKGKRVLAGEKSQQEQAISEFLGGHAKFLKMREPEGAGVYAQPGLLEAMGEQIAGFIRLSWNIPFAPGEVSKELDALKSIDNIPQASADGRFLAWQEYQKPVFHMLNMQTMQENQITLPLAGQVSRWALSPSGGRIAVLEIQGHTGMKQIKIFNIENEAVIKITAIPCGPYEDQLYFFEEDGLLKLLGYNPVGKVITIWNAQTGAQLGSKNLASSLPEIAKALILAVSFVNGEIAMAVHVHGVESGIKIIILHLDSGNVLGSSKIAAYKNIKALAFDFDHKRFAGLGHKDDWRVEDPIHFAVWDTFTGNLLYELKKLVNCDFMLFSPDGNFLIARERFIDKVAVFRVWNLPELERQYREKQTSSRPAAAEEESKEAAAVPVPPGAALASTMVLPSSGVSRRITVEQAKQEFLLPSNIMQRTAWIDGLNNLAKGSADGKINYVEAWTLYEEIKSIQSY